MATVEQTISADSGLSKRAYVGYAAFFMIIPYACVLASSALYYRWRRTRPVSANQINRLGFIAFGVQMLLGFLLAWLMPAQQGEMPAPSPAGIRAVTPVVAATGTLVPFPGKPFQISAPPGWTVGSPQEGIDVVIVDPSDNIVVHAYAIPMVDLPPPQRDLQAFHDFMRKSFGPELTDQEDLPTFPCSLLGHRVEARATDFTSDGEGRWRQARVVAIHGKYICAILVTMRPSLAEEAGDGAVQNILAWVQATDRGDIRRREDRLGSDASPASADRAAAGTEFTRIQPRTPKPKAFQEHRGRDMNFVEKHMRGVLSAAREYEITTDGTALNGSIDQLNRSLELDFTRLILEDSAKEVGRK